MSGGGQAGHESFRALRAVRSRWTCLLTAVMTSGRLHAQNDSIQASRRRLEEIRAERDRLKLQQQRLQGQVHDVARTSSATSSASGRAPTAS